MINCTVPKNRLLIPSRNENRNLDCYELITKGWTLGVTEKIDTIKQLWDQLAPKDNLFLQSDYLTVLEKSPANHLGFRYGILYNEDKPKGIVYMQTYWVRMEDSINKDKASKAKGFLKNIGGKIRNWFIKKAVFNVIICGNVLLTGRHGYYFGEDTDSHIAADLAQQALDISSQLLEKKEGKKTHIQMFKDFPCKDRESEISPVMKKATYHSYGIQPAMYMRLPNDWKSFEDYLNEMHSKYRVRARRAAKKGEELEKRELSLSEVEQFNKEIYNLYLGIANNVGFNAFTLHPEYFLELKKKFGNKLKIIGYFFEGKLVAFFSAIINGKTLEAHFLGVNHELNREFQVYLNILYAIIDMAIYHKMQMINFARTALEIKSSVGAVPCDLNIYVRHRNRISSSVMKFIFEYLSPKEEWQPRSPFKDMSIVK